MTPKYEEYGAFRDSPEFAELFPDFEKLQRAAAREIVDTVLEHCDGTDDFPEIECIVDLGCGDGSLLLAIKGELDARSAAGAKGAGLKRSYLGIDTDEAMINRATESAKQAHSDVIFIRHDFAKGVPELPSPHAWDKTALMCLGHTWFHIEDQDALIKQIKTANPALILIDVFASWDDAVRAMGPHSLAPYDEEFRLTGGKLYSLRTERDNPPVSRGDFIPLSRGIFLHDRKGGGEWIIRTRQVARGGGFRAMLAYEELIEEGNQPTQEAAKPSPSKPSLLKRARNNWTLTGIDATEAPSFAGGLIVREFTHRSGWGAMICTVIVTLSDEARRLNEAYFGVVSELLDSLLVAPMPAVSGAAAGETAKSQVRRLVEIFHRGEVAVLLPFDRTRAFARMVPLKPQQKQCSACPPPCPRAPAAARDPGDKGHFECSALCRDLSEIDLVLERPNRIQFTIPTAYSLYHATLDLVSSPIGFTLDSAPEYEKATVDLAYDILEKDFLRLCDAEEGFRSFILVPFYFGSLPLFVLMLEEPTFLPVAATNAQVYAALAVNLEQQLRAVIHDDIFRSRVVVPFVRSAWNKRRDDYDPRAWKARIREAWKRATGRPWKSWVTALPSHRLADLAVTELANVKAGKMLEDALDAIGQSPVYKISLELQKVKFFSNGASGGHDKFVPKEHRGQIKGLALLFGTESFRDAAPVTTCKLLSSEEAKGWVPLLYSCMSRLEACICAQEAECCQEDSAAECDEAFQLLKDVFCRTLENTGEAFRFSFSRLVAMAAVMAEVDSCKVLTKHADCRSYEILVDPKNEFFRKYRVAGSEAADRAEELAWVLAYLARPNGEIEFEVNDGENAITQGNGEFSLSLKVTRSSALAEGGSDCLRFRRLVVAFFGRCTDEIWRGPLEWRIRIIASRMADRQEVGVRCEVVECGAE
jgi:hypothetical protein